MNQKDFEMWKRGILEKTTCRPIEGAVRLGGNESLEHFLKKAKLVWLYGGRYGISVFSEVKFSCNAIADVLVLKNDGNKGIAKVYEVLDTEKDTDESIKKKRIIYKNLNFEFETVSA